MVKVFFEGTMEKKNGDLRASMGRLFEKALRGKNPRFIACNSKQEAVDKFLSDKEAEHKFILIDSDSYDSNQKFRDAHFAKYNLHKYANKIFFMVQEMETWFLSQPAVLDKYFRDEISKRIPRRNLCEIDDPSDRLRDYTRHLGSRNVYHKVRDGCKILERLDIEVLRHHNCFSVDVNGLILACEKANLAP